MKAQTIRPSVRNGRISKRPKDQVLTQAIKTRSRSNKSRRIKKQALENHRGSRILVTLIVVGGLVASGFIFALRAQISAHRIGQAEAALRAELEEVSNQQRYEMLDQQRALSTGETYRAAIQSGLIQPKFDRPFAVKYQATQPAKVGLKPKKESGSQRQTQRR